MTPNIHDRSAGLSRRDVLRYGLAGTFAVAASGLLVACGSGGSPSNNPTAAAGPPRMGGTLTVGMPTGGSTETIDVWQTRGTNDYARVLNLYDTLFEYDEQLKVGPSLAESGEASADGMVWTIRLRKGVTFHDGSPFTADDVLHNVRHWMEPNAGFHTQAGSFIDPNGVTKIDDHTLELKLLGPDAQFDGILAFVYGGIKSKNEVPGGPPIGTGPFKYVSFQPGAQSEFVRFENHWRDNPVYLDRLVINSSYTEEGARTNALRSGQVDMLPQVAFGLANTFESGRTFLMRSPSPSFQNFTMRVDTPPFDDVRVRQAMRLLVDRQAMVDIIYSGHGEVSNDVPGQGLPLHDTSLVRERDVDQARSLLKQAGQEGLTVTLETSTAVDGLVQAATLFKEQAGEGGVTVNIERVDPASYFDTTARYGKMVFAQTTYFPVPSHKFVWEASFMGNTPTNETHWFAAPSYARTEQLLAEAKATSDEGKLQELWHELQKQQFDEGGFINWGTYEFLDAASSKVQGLTPSQYLAASAYRFRNVWFAG